MQRLFLATTLLCAISCASATPRTGTLGTLVDLTHSFDADTIYWPTEEGFVLETEFEGFTPGGYFYEANRFRAAEHGGTHLDAPVHFAEKGQSADQIPLEHLVGEGVLIDVAAACARDRDHVISREEIEAWEAEHGAIPDGAIVLFRTGFERYWPDRVPYLGTAERGAEGVARLSFPGIGADAARWLIAERHIHAVGLDTASIDPGTSTTFEAHRTLFAENVPAFENLAGLDRLPPRGFEVVALPMKIAGGSGGPLRAIAILPADAAR